MYDRWILPLVDWVVQQKGMECICARYDLTDVSFIVYNTGLAKLTNAEVVAHSFADDDIICCITVQHCAKLSFYINVSHL